MSSRKLCSSAFVQPGDVLDDVDDNCSEGSCAGVETVRSITETKVLTPKYIIYNGQKNGMKLKKSSSEIEITKHERFNSAQMAPDDIRCTAIDEIFMFRPSYLSNSLYSRNSDEFPYFTPSTKELAGAAAVFLPNNCAFDRNSMGSAYGSISAAVHKDSKHRGSTDTEDEQASSLSNVSISNGSGTLDYLPKSPIIPYSTFGSSNNGCPRTSIHSDRPLSQPYSLPSNSSVASSPYDYVTLTGSQPKLPPSTPTSQILQSKWFSYLPQTEVINTRRETDIQPTIAGLPHSNDLDTLPIYHTLEPPYSEINCVNQQAKTNLTLCADVHHVQSSASDTCTKASLRAGSVAYDARMSSLCCSVRSSRSLPPLASYEQWSEPRKPRQSPPVSHIYNPYSEVHSMKYFTNHDPYCYTDSLSRSMITTYRKLHESKREQLKTGVARAFESNFLLFIHATHLAVCLVYGLLVTCLLMVAYHHHLPAMFSDAPSILLLILSILIGTLGTAIGIIGLAMPIKFRKPFRHLHFFSMLFHMHAIFNAVCFVSSLAAIFISLTMATSLHLLFYLAAFLLLPVSCTSLFNVAYDAKLWLKVHG